MKPANFAYHFPSSMDEAGALLGQLAADNGRILAGGQTLVPMMAFRMALPAHLIDINGIAELAEIAVAGGKIRIGACVRHAALETAGAVPGPTGALLQQIVHHIAHYPIRTRGTVCGSLVNADPASEWCCAVAALDGVVIAQSRTGMRRIAAADYFAGVMQTDLHDDELVIAVELPLLSADARFGFAEYSRRPGDFALAMVLGTYSVDTMGIMVNAHLAVGGVEPFPRRITASEDALNGVVPSAAVFAAAADIAAEAVEPMDEGTAIYRRMLVRTLTRRVLEGTA